VPSSRPPPADLPAALRHVRWIGGGSGAGKSTIARRLATDHGLRIYDTDAVMADHGTRISNEDAPYLTAFKAMDMNERWVNRDPVTMLETFHWYRGEGFDLIVEDLLELTGEAGVIAEGFRLLPHLVAPMLAAPENAVWLLPTPEFRAAAFRNRDPARDFTQRTGDPERAQSNRAERDRLFTSRLRRSPAARSACHRGPHYHDRG
jgi:2-phosphoglycerate kinase